MAGNEEYTKAVNPYIEQGLAFTQRPKSLLDQKLDSLAAGSLAKQYRLDPAAAAEAELDRQREILAKYSSPAGSSSNAVDAFQSSVYQTLQHAKDFAGLGDGIERTNEQIRVEGDKWAGFTPEARERLVAAPQKAVTDELAKGNYWEAAKAVPGAIIGTVADSGGSLVGMGLGAAGTAAVSAVAPAVAGVTGLAALGSKLSKSYKAVDAAVKASDTAENAADTSDKLSLIAKTAKLAKSGAKAAPKTAAQMSVVNADMTQRQINTYRENFGKNPEPGEVVGMYAVNMVTTILDPAIVKNLHIPKFKSEITKEMSELASNMVKGSNILHIAKRMGSAAAKVGYAGSAEAVQEYFQTWGEVINTEIGPKDAGNFLSAVARELGDEGNQIQAMAGAYLGAGAGGGIRAATAAPSLAAGTALDATKATAKGAGKVFKAAVVAGRNKTAEATAKATVSYMSKAKTQETIDKDKARRAVHKELVKANDSKISSVEGYDTFGSIDDKSISERFTHVAGTDNLNDPKVFKKVKNKVLAGYKGEVEASALKLEADLVANIVVSEAKKLGKEVVKAGKYVGVTQERVDATIAYAKSQGKKIKDATIHEIKNIESSATRGLVDSAIAYGTSKSKEGLASLNEVVNENSPEAIRNVATMLEGDMPELSKVLNSMANRKEDSNKNLEDAGGEILSVKSIGPNLKDVRQRGSIKSNPAAVAFDLIEDIKKVPEDIETIDFLSEALDVYVEDESYKKQSSGSLSEYTVENMRTRLEEQRNLIKESVTEKAKDVAKDVAKSATDYAGPALDGLSSAGKAAVSYVDDAIGNWADPEGSRERKVKSTLATAKEDKTRQDEAQSAYDANPEDSALKTALDEAKKAYEKSSSAAEAASKDYSSYKDKSDTAEKEVVESATEEKPFIEVSRKGGTKHKVDLTESGNKFIAVVKGLDQEYSKQSDSDAEVFASKVVDTLTEKSTVTKMANAFSTADPEVLTAILASYAPVLGSEDTLNKIQKGIAKAVNTSESDIETVNSSTETVEDVEPTGNVEVDEDGTNYTDKQVSEVDVKKYSHNLLDSQDICKL